jgi:hypothetical protein
MLLIALINQLVISSEDHWLDISVFARNSKNTNVFDSEVVDAECDDISACEGT